MLNESNTEFNNNASVKEVNGTEDSESMHGRSSYIMPLLVFSIALCLTGLLGNGIVLWFLCLKIKRNHFTVYILHLAAADFTFLFGLWVWMVYLFMVLNGLRSTAVADDYIALLLGLLYNFGFNASIYLLMAIAMERCLAVLFPFWYQCHRSQNSSVYVCIGSWLFSVLITGLENMICDNGHQYHAPGSQSCTNVYFFTTAVYLTVVPIMVLSSLTLLFTIQTASKHCQSTKLYIVIVISVTVFLISVVPARILGLLLYFNVMKSNAFLVEFFFVTSLCSAFNCSANPYIYMAVGQWGMRECSIQKILEKVFKEAMESRT
ncbi:proto-oncogene Mas-like [Hyperolius riggenbachi]|uniref:proto-oncogene Mas-like n=1 Tax=Hyperolius riggenbachi TaxID=752182 RepID=UPI0035A27385